MYDDGMCAPLKRSQWPTPGYSLYTGLTHRHMRTSSACSQDSSHGLCRAVAQPTCSDPPGQHRCCDVLQLVVQRGAPAKDPAARAACIRSSAWLHGMLLHASGLAWASGHSLLRVACDVLCISAGRHDDCGTRTYPTAAARATTTRPCAMLRPGASSCNASAS
jgi:hypothetical protein